MTADHEAQRQAADSQVTDQGALEAVAQSPVLCGRAGDPNGCRNIAHHRADAQLVLSALAEAGYTVVKTEDVRWVVRVVGMNPTPLGVASEAIFGPFPSVDAASDWLDTYRTKVEVHLAPQIMPLWVPVPEGSEEGGER